MAKHPLQTALEYLKDGMDIEIRTYSGRGMYGRNCLAITADRINMLVLGMAIADYNHSFEDDNSLEVPQYQVEDYRQDNIGLGVVVYWPRIEFVDEDEKEDFSHIPYFENEEND